MPFAVRHVDYIRREGNFAQVEKWQQNKRFGGYFISTNQTKNIFDGQNFLLYKTDDFCSIRNSENGIKVTENYFSYHSGHCSCARRQNYESSTARYLQHAIIIHKF